MQHIDVSFKFPISYIRVLFTQGFGASPIVSDLVSSTAHATSTTHPDRQVRVLRHEALAYDRRHLSLLRLRIRVPPRLDTHRRTRGLHPSSCMRRLEVKIDLDLCVSGDSSSIRSWLVSKRHWTDTSHDDDDLHSCSCFYPLNGDDISTLTLIERGEHVFCMTADLLPASSFIDKNAERSWVSVR